MSEAEIVNGMAANNMVMASNPVPAATILKGKEGLGEEQKRCPTLNWCPSHPLRRI
jgi:hypothetical protein